MYFKDFYIKISNSIIVSNRFQSFRIGAKHTVSSIILHTLFIGRNEQIEEKIAGAVN